MVLYVVSIWLSSKNDFSKKNCIMLLFKDQFFSFDSFHFFDDLDNLN